MISKDDKCRKRQVGEVLELSKQEQQKVGDHAPSSDSFAVEISAEWPIEERIGLGDSKPPTMETQAYISLLEDDFEIGPDGEPLAAAVAKQLDSMSAVKKESIADVLKQGNCQVVIATHYRLQDANEKTQCAEHLKSALIHLGKGELASAMTRATENGIYTLPINGKLELTIVPWDSPFRTEQLLLSEVAQAQQARETIDTERDKWLEEQAIPLIDRLNEQISRRSLPRDIRQRLAEARDSLVRDAYYRGIIKTTEAAKMARVGEQRLRKIARQGRLGFDVSGEPSEKGRYVFSGKETEHFASRGDRPTDDKTSPP